MNREQRRRDERAQRRSDSIAMVNMRDVVFPQQMTVAECETVLLQRLHDNLNETGHPFHHRTVNGAIVQPDPTLEYFLSRLSASRQHDLREEWQRKAKPDAPESIPVNRTYYGIDPYKRN